MRIDVTYLVHGLNTLSVDEASATLHLPEPRETEAGDTEAHADAALGATFPGPVHAELRITRNEDEFLLDAELSSPAELECGRCLTWYPATVETSFRGFVRRGEGPSAHRNFEDQIDEGGVIYHTGRYLDIGEAVREALLLAVPMRPLCREDCRGLCPGCGADLNRETCSCASAQGTRAS